MFLATVQPTIQPTIQPTETPKAAAANTPDYAPFDSDLAPPPIPAPTPVPLIDHAEDVTVFALLGNDVDSRKGGRTDSIILAAVSRQSKTITLLSIPRDLYIAVPGWTMQRINLAYAHGGENGASLFKQTIAYNLGLPVVGAGQRGGGAVVRLGNGRTGAASLSCGDGFARGER